MLKMYFSAKNQVFKYVTLSWIRSDLNISDAHSSGHVSELNTAAGLTLCSKKQYFKMWMERIFRKKNLHLVNPLIY